VKLIEPRGKVKTIRKLTSNLIKKEIKGGVLNKYKLTSLRTKVRDSKKKANKPEEAGSQVFLLYKILIITFFHYKQADSRLPHSTTVRVAVTAEKVIIFPTQTFFKPLCIADTI
jgi:hypothetical protein